MSTPVNKVLEISEGDVGYNILRIFFEKVDKNNEFLSSLELREFACEKLGIGSDTYTRALRKLIERDILIKVDNRGMYKITEKIEL